MTTTTATHTTRDAVLLTCRKVALTFGRGDTAVAAVRDADCTVRAGDRIAICGPSGSGKSTLLHLMAGLEQATQGIVTWPGLPDRDEDLTGGIGVVFQSPSLVPTLNVTENVALPLELAGLSSTDPLTRVRTCLDAVGAGQLGGRLPEELSGGQAQRVAVARVLAQQPRLILADEPTGQLDHHTGQQVLDALLLVAERTGAALVVSTHDESVAMRLRSRWGMHDGRLDANPVLMAGAAS